MIKNYEQLQFVTPEYDALIITLDSVASNLLRCFPDHIEYYKTSLRLPLKTEGMKPNAYYAVTKSLSYPFPDNPDWALIPAKLGLIQESERDCGHLVIYENPEGILTSKVLPYTNNEWGTPENPEVVPETEIQKIIDELSKSTPVHPDVEVAVPKASRNGTFIDGLLQNIPNKD